jgi:hypothetical protein
MYLAEAIKEKEFIENSINSLCNRINFLAIVTDETVVKLNIELVKNKVKELENLYKELQKYTIIIDRAKSKSVIVLNGENFSIADAENILITMGIRLEFLVNLLDSIGSTNLNPKLFICMDTNEVEDKINSLREDIKIIEVGIEKSLWSIEV